MAKGGLEESGKELLALLEGAIAGMAPKSEFGILFSAGIDSLLIALICKKLGLPCRCFFGYLDGFGKPKDRGNAERAAKRFGFELENAKVQREELPGLVERVSGIIGSKKRLDLGIALPLYTACARAGEKGMRVVFCGQGADELFLGYARFRESKDLQKASAKALEVLMERFLPQCEAVAASNGVHIKFPFLSPTVVQFAKNLPNEFKLQGERNKAILREIALQLGSGKDFAERKKVAAQYGSNFDKGLKKIL